MQLLTKKVHLFSYAFICVFLLNTLCLNNKLVMASPQKQLYGETSFSGTFLAAYYAQKNYDYDHAFDFFSALDTHQFSFLLEETLSMAIITGHFDEASKVSHKLTQDQHKIMLPRLFLALEHVKKQNFTKAEKELSHIPEELSEHFLIILVKAWISAGKKDKSQAVKNLENPQKATKKLFQLHRTLILDYLNFSDEALASLKSLLPEGKKQSFYYVNLLGNLIARNEGKQKAQNFFQEFKNENIFSAYLYDYWQNDNHPIYQEPLIQSASDGLAHALSMAALTLYFSGDIQNGILLLKLSLYLKPDFDFAYLNLAEIYSELLQYKKSNSYIKFIKPSSPFFWTAALQQIGNFEDTQDMEKALAHAEELSQQRVSDTQSLLVKGDLLRQQKEYLLASQTYTQALHRIEVHKLAEDWTVYYSRGVCFERLGKWDEAERDLLKALELEPNQPFVLNYLGYSWIEQEKNLEKALNMVETAVAARPNDGYITDSLGWVLYKLGKYNDAVIHLEKAGVILTDDPVIHDHIGDVYWQLNRKIEARFQWKKALGMSPDEELKTKLLNKIENGLPKQP